VDEKLEGYRITELGSGDLKAIEKQEVVYP
jgi:hypothetical protein